MLKDLKQYVDLLFNINDPIFYSIIFAVLIFILLYLIFKNIIYPLQKKFVNEKNELELKNARLMALFAELDPDPVLRINKAGEIIYINKSAGMLLNDERLEGKNIKSIIPSINFSIENFITKDRKKTIYFNNNSKNYTIQFKGISSLEIAQLYFHDITEKIEYEKKLKDLSVILQNNIEEYRQRIARELHDDIGQNLLILKMNLINKYQHIIKAAGQEASFNESMDFFQNILSELKIILYDLKPPMLEEMGLSQALSSLVNKVSEEGSIKGSLNSFGFNERLNPKMEIALYRIAQEALNNIIKHSHAKEFSINLIRKDGLIKMIINDDGIGFHMPDKGRQGYGLLNISERVESFNGVFKMDTSDNNGTMLVIELPLESEK
jgi:signal transduction histidine kinase